MHPTDFASLVRSDAAETARKTSKSASELVHKHSTFEALLYPIVIVNPQGSICYMNSAARDLLAEGLDARLASHVRRHPDMGTVTQVHFKLQNGRDMFLKIGLGEIEWLGEKAIQVSISNVTPYLAMIQELQKERETPKPASDEPAALPPEAAQPTAAQTADELRSLRLKLHAEARARRIAQEKIAQFQQEMAGYRQSQENPSALIETEERLAKRVQEAVVAEEQVGKLTEELRAARETNIEQEERVRRLRRLADDLQKKYETLAAEARTRAQEQELLQSKLHEETAARLAAEAEIDRVRQQAATAQPKEPEPEEIDADFIADLRQEFQAALRASAPDRSSAIAPPKPGGMMPRAGTARRLP